MALAADGRFVEDPLTRLNPRRLSAPLERDLLAGAKSRAKWQLADESIDRGILISGPCLGTYGHHLLDFLPSAAMLGHYDAFTDWPLLLSADAPAWVLPMVEAFFGRSREILSFSCQQQYRTKVGQLCVPWVLCQPAFHPSVRGVFDQIAAVATEDRDDAPGRRVCFVREQQFDKRHLTNADAVTALLQTRGFERVQADRWPSSIKYGCLPRPASPPERRAPDCMAPSSRRPG